MCCSSICKDCLSFTTCGPAKLSSSHFLFLQFLFWILCLPSSGIFWGNITWAGQLRWYHEAIIFRSHRFNKLWRLQSMILYCIVKCNMLNCFSPFPGYLHVFSECWQCSLLYPSLSLLPLPVTSSQFYVTTAQSLWKWDDEIQAVNICAWGKMTFWARSTNPAQNGFEGQLMTTWSTFWHFDINPNIKLRVLGMLSLTA